MQGPLAWINGTLKPFSEAALPVWDLGIVAGAAVTEMARTFRHQPFRLEQHVQRLMSSCQTLGFPVQYSSEQLLTAARQVVSHNTELINSEDDLGIVAFVTAGTNATYLAGQASEFGSTVIHTFHLPVSMWRESFREGVRLRIPGIRQIPEQCFPVSVKVRNRLHWWLADRESTRLEPGSRALLLDQEDNVTESSSACFFAVLDGQVVTPPRHVLNSMSREVVEGLLEKLGVPCRRGPIHCSQLRDISEAFLSSTPFCVLPVSRIDGNAVGCEVPGPVFRQLLAAWNELVGIDIAAQICGKH